MTIAVPVTIASLCARDGRSLVSLAAALGVDRNTLGRWSSGEVEVGLDRLTEIRRIFGLEADDYAELCGELAKARDSYRACRSGRLLAGEVEGG